MALVVSVGSLFAVQPLVAVLGLAASASLAQEHVLLYMLGIPTLVPLFVAAYAVAGERQQGGFGSTGIASACPNRATRRNC